MSKFSDLKRRVMESRAARSRAGRILVGAVTDFGADGALRQAASISFYTIFALSPLLVILVAVAGFVFGEERVRDEVVGQVGELVGEDGKALAGTVLKNAQKPGEGIIGTVAGVAMLIAGASVVFSELKKALNTVWDVERKPGGGVRGFLRGRVIAVGMVLVIACLLMVSLIFSAGLSATESWMGSSLPFPKAGLHTLDFAVSLVAFTLLFAVVFRVLPDAKIAWRDVWFGAFVTALLFNVGKLLIGLYLGKTSLASVYGAAGSLVIVLVWIYYSAAIFLFGAELTQAHAAISGREIEPTENARRLGDGEAARGTGNAGTGKAEGARRRAAAEVDQRAGGDGGLGAPLPR